MINGKKKYTKNSGFLNQNLKDGVQIHHPKGTAKQIPPSPIKKGIKTGLIGFQLKKKKGY